MIKVFTFFCGLVAFKTGNLFTGILLWYTTFFKTFK